MTPLLVTALMSFACLVLGALIFGPIGYLIGYTRATSAAVEAMDDVKEMQRQAMEAQG